jgi:hypothetical protein
MLVPKVSDRFVDVGPLDSAGVDFRESQRLVHAAHFHEGAQIGIIDQEISGSSLT